MELSICTSIKGKKKEIVIQNRERQINRETGTVWGGGQDKRKEIIFIIGGNLNVTKTLPAKIVEVKHVKKS